MKLRKRMVINKSSNYKLLDKSKYLVLEKCSLIKVDPILECIMDLIDSPGLVTDYHANVPDASSCLKYCNDNDNCSLWTYHDGMCYMKHEKTIRMEIDNRISGTKNCNENGKL